jgi:hypothetical protein
MTERTIDPFKKKNFKLYASIRKIYKNMLEFSNIYDKMFYLKNIFNIMPLKLYLYYKNWKYILDFKIIIILCLF